MLVAMLMKLIKNQFNSRLGEGEGGISPFLNEILLRKSKSLNSRNISGSIN